MIGWVVVVLANPMDTVAAGSGCSLVGTAPSPSLKAGLFQEMVI